MKDHHTSLFRLCKPHKLIAKQLYKDIAATELYYAEYYFVSGIHPVLTNFTMQCNYCVTEDTTTLPVVHKYMT